ncbi:MAG: class I SAM-dependent rRNA methyltransferase [Ignavibacteriaceae bacterium]|nr:class I SAM-dependent rRNA methyltransferase [Ignavibacteriaceae bacterium]
MKKIKLKKNEDKRIREGHLWVFSNEILEVESNTENGELIEIYDFSGKFLGVGFYNKSSLIAVRVLSKNKIISLVDFFREKIDNAFRLRKEIYPYRDSYRVVFGESDFLPGLIIDKFLDTYVLQINSIGIQKNIETVVKILVEGYGAKNVLTKNEKYYRDLEGLSDADQILFGTPDEVIISDGKVKYSIDFGSSQKTGFYFDQSDNREFIELISKGKMIVDAFCNSGGFGLHAAFAGASEITFIDSSEREIDSAKKNFQLNDFKNLTNFIVDDVFNQFEKLIAEKREFDVVMIDPPAFAKNKKNLAVAIKGYEKLNNSALRLVKSGGYLVTSSCSFHIKQKDFMEIVNRASIKASKKVQLIQFNNASKDHPQLSSMMETNYLKFAVFRVLG